jgi:ribosomal protein S27E
LQKKVLDNDINMTDRITEVKCPYCGKQTEVFILVGQTYSNKCEHCGRTIVFDNTGEIIRK